jgi:hypothetical protein
MRTLSGAGGANSVNAARKQAFVYLCLNVLHRINKIFMRFTLCMQMILLPQWTKYDRRVFGIYLLQLISCDFMQLTLLKTLQFYYKNTNFLLVMSLATVVPFLRAVYSLWTFIPCPNLAAVISNVGLAVAFVMLLVLGMGTYESSIWIIYAFIMSAWPWMILASMISRLFIDRNLQKNPFSPVKELPFLGLLGAFGQCLMLMSIKTINISDATVLSLLDSVLAAIIAPVLMGAARMQLHARQVKVYLIIVVIMLLYLWGDIGPGDLQVSAPTMEHVYFIVARLLLVIRSLFVKRTYAKFHHAKIPPTPPENAMIYYNTKEPRMHRFRMFPSPILHTLDVIFDSGLRDIDFHGMGPLGTEDLFMLTESSYLLPIATLMAWTGEFSDLKYGFLPPSLYELTGGTAKDAMSTSAAAAGAITTVAEDVKTTEVVGVILVVVGFCISRFLGPMGASKGLFDRGSSSQNWKYQPLMLIAPFFAFDALYLNPRISKFQIIMAGIGCAMVAYYRSILWNLFKRKHYLLCTQRMQYRQPSVMRTLQKRTLLEFANNTSIDDYSVLLMDTAIMNGNNIKEIARDTGITVWDPSPTSTAAWKLAFSLVIKSLKKQKQQKQLKDQEKAQVTEYITSLILDIANKSVDLAEGHGARLTLAQSVHGVVAKRCAIRKLHRAALMKRNLRHRRKMGQLATVPMTLSTADGTIRTSKDMTTLDSKGRLPPMTSQMPALPPPPAAAAGVPADNCLSRATQQTGY